MLRLVTACLAAAALVATGCGADAASSDSDLVDTSDPLDALRLPELQEINASHAATSEVCYWCHANTNRSESMRDAAGRPISPWDVWRGSMMAMSARDPFFRATMSVEQAAFPDQAEAIGQECMRCHAPAAFAEASLTGVPLPGARRMEQDDAIGHLARDGATCVACHMLDPSSAGGPETWSGHHVYDAERRLYGPHAEPYASPMQGFAEFTPTHHESYGEAGMCASCHMLQTEARTADGELTGHVLTEQAPFVEWRSSSFADPDSEGARTCQQCHLPQTDREGNTLQTRIARGSFGFDSSALDPRQPFGRHQMVGGNAYALEVIYDHRFDLGVGGPGPSIAEAIVETREALAGAATIEPGAPVLSDRQLSLPVRVQNRVGHKLPTGYPTRRAWLEVRITDATGADVLHIGAVDGRGRLIDAAGSPLASEQPGGPIEPHRQVLTGADTPIVWQSWMQDDTGAPTTRLLRGTRFHKDNRLLPAGFAPSEQDAPLVAAVGVEGDPDFGPGTDGVIIQTELSGSGPWTAKLTVRYQSFSPRALDELLSIRTPQTRGLAAMIEGRPVPAEVLAHTQIVIDP